MNKYLIPGIIAVLLIAGGGWYLSQSDTSTPHEIPGWKTYKNSEYGLEFSAQYPGDWNASEIITEVDPITKTFPSGMVYVAFQEKGLPKEGVTGLGEKVMIENWEDRWAVYPYSRGSPLRETNVETLIAHIGNQFENRIEKRENVPVAGTTGIKVVVTSSSNPNLFEEVVIVEDRNTVYVIHNLDVATTNNTFDTFYTSFRLN